MHVDPLAAAFAENPELFTRLLAEHVCNDHGRCRACTQGGTGIPWAPWPCGPQAYAAEAQRIHRLTHGPATSVSSAA